MEIRGLSKLEVHYVFDDDSHRIEAFARNSAERELLALVKESAFLLNLEFRVECEPTAEGGFREVWTFLGQPQVASLAAILALLVALFPPENPDEAALIELQTEEAKLSIEKLRRDLGYVEEASPTGPVSEEIARQLARFPKVASRRSNFYERLSQNEKVSVVEFTPLDEANVPQGPPVPIERGQFARFILQSRDLEPLLDNAAEIEVVSPVLRSGRYKWRGIYDGEPITFAMGDQQFKNQVLTKQVSFQNGSTLVCVLEADRKLNEAGEAVLSNYRVSVVLSLTAEGRTTETPQGRAKRAADKLMDAQDDMFSP